MSTSLTRIPCSFLEAEKTQIPGKVCPPQKWPPARTMEMFWRLVGSVPKPFIGYPKSSEEMVTPA